MVFQCLFISSMNAFNVLVNFFLYRRHSHTQRSRLKHAPLYQERNEYMKEHKERYLATI